MPHMSKKVLSQYLRTECKRQLKLNLYPDNGTYRAEREIQNMPPKQPPRPGLEYFTEAGEEWQAEKLHDLSMTFGTDRIVGSPFIHRSGQIRYNAISLEEALSRSSPDRYILEAEFNVGMEFERALGIEEYRQKYNLNYAILVQISLKYFLH